MTTLVEIPGVGEVEFPDSMSEAEISGAIQKLLGGGVDSAPSAPVVRQGVVAPDGQSAKVPLTDEAAAALQAPAAEDPGFLTPFLRGGSRRFLENLLAIPEVAVNLPAQATLGTLGIPFQPFNMPSAAEVTAGTQTALQAPAALLAGDNIGQRFQQNLQRQQEIDATFRQQAPTATMLGEVGGDIATIATGRAGFRGLTGTTLTAEKAAPVIASRAQTILGRAMQTAGRSVMRTGTRAAETGAEAAALAALQNADPAEAGAIAAGVQTGGDLLARPVIDGLRKAGLTKVVLGATVLSIAAQEVVPGGFQIIEETLKTRAKEVGIAALLSGGALAATGRIPKEFAGPAFAEIVSLIPRGALVSGIVGLQEDKERVAPVLQQLSRDPNAFGAEARDALAKTLTEGGDLVATIDRLQESDPRFARTFAAVSKGEPVPAGDLIADAVQADVGGGADALRKPTKVAETAAARLGRERARGFGWEQSSVGPRKFISNVIEQGGGELLQKRLSKSDWQDVLTADLEHRLMEASRRQGNKLVIDGNRLAAAWSRLPKAARALYPRGTEDAVLALAERARQDQSVSGGLSLLLARSLLTDGQLRGLLIEKPKGGKRRASGLLEN